MAACELHVIKGAALWQLPAALLAQVVQGVRCVQYVAADVANGRVVKLLPLTNC